MKYHHIRCRIKEKNISIILIVVSKPVKGWYLKGCINLMSKKADINHDRKVLEALQSFFEEQNNFNTSVNTCSGVWVLNIFAFICMSIYILLFWRDDRRAYLCE